MNRRHFSSLLGGTALASLTALRVYTDLSEDCGVPIARDDGLSVASVNDEKLIDRAALCGMADQLATSSANIHAVVVARSGKLVFERYFRGSDEVAIRRPEPRVPVQVEGGAVLVDHEFGHELH